MRADDGVRTDRQTVRREHDLHHSLVHPDRRGKYARADIGDVGELEESLDRSVLTERTVQHREDHIEIQARHQRLRPIVSMRGTRTVDREDRLFAGVSDEVDLASGARRTMGFEPRLLDDFTGRHRRRGPFGDAPPAVLLDPNRHRFVAGAIEMGEHRCRRCERHFMLTGSPAV